MAATAAAAFQEAPARRTSRERSRGRRPARDCFLLAAMLATLAMHGVVSSACEARGAFLAGRWRSDSHGQSRATSALQASRNQFDKSRLEKEASFTEGLMKQWNDFWKPKDAELTEEELEERARREESCTEIQKALKSLKLNVVASNDEEGNEVRRAAPIGVLQSQAKQSLAIYAAVRGKEQLVTDVLLGMRIEAKDFSERNILVVPAIVDLATKSLVEFPPNIRDSKLMRQGAVALPFASNDEERDAWGELLAGEFREAEDQDLATEAQNSGLALIVRSNGEIARRGVGRPQWKVVFKDTDE